MTTRPSPAIGAALLASAVLLAAYAITLAPGLVGGDTPELITAAHTVGIPHQPGYPTYTLIGRVASLVPVGGAAARVTFVSALAGALAGGSFALLLSGLGSSAVAAGLWSIAAGLSIGTWSQALVAEVYTMGLFLGLAALSLVDRWRRTGAPRLLVIGAYVGGLAVSHQPLMVWLLPGVVALVSRRLLARTVHPRLVMGSIGAFVLPFTAFALLPIRSAARPAVDYAQIGGVGDFFYHALGIASRSELLSEGGAGVRSTWELIGSIARTDVGPLTLLVMLLAMAGLVLSWRRDRERLLLLALPIPLILGFASVYAIHDVENYLLMPTWLAVALGASALADPVFGERRRAIATVLGLACVVTAAVANRPECSRRRDHIVDDFVHNVLRDVPEGGALFLLTETLVGPFVFHRDVLGERDDVAIVDMTGKVRRQTLGFRELTGDWRTERWRHILRLAADPPAELRGRAFCTIQYDPPVTAGHGLTYRREGLTFRLVPDTGGADEPAPVRWDAYRFRLPGHQLLRRDRRPFTLVPIVRRLYGELGRAAAQRAVADGRDDDALAVIQDAFDFAPRSSALFQLRALVYTRRGDVTRAEEALRHSLAIAPDAVQSLNALAVLLMNRGEAAEAEALLDHAVEVDPRDALTRLNLGNLLARDAARMSEALSHLRAFVELAPDDPDAEGARAFIRSREAGNARP